MMISYFRRFAGLMSFDSNLCFSHFFSSGPDGTLESRMTGAAEATRGGWLTGISGAAEGTGGGSRIGGALILFHHADEHGDGGAGIADEDEPRERLARFCPERSEPRAA